MFDMEYEINVVKGAQSRLKVYVRNCCTDEDISIDENIKDVEMLYKVLDHYFKYQEELGNYE